VTRFVCEKVAQNVAQLVFCRNYYTTFTVLMSSLKIWATSLIYKETIQCKQSPNRQNSPNPVTLLPIQPEQFVNKTRNLYHEFNIKPTQHNRQTTDVDGVSTEPPRKATRYDSSTLK
jgi:hypothetical protein